MSNAIYHAQRKHVKTSCSSRGRLHNVPAQKFPVALNSLRARLYLATSAK